MEGIPITVIMYHCMSTCFLSVVITMSEQVVPFMKPVKILKGFGAQFGDEMLSRTQVYDWSKSFKEAQTEVEKMQRLQFLRGKYG
jgi:hypothetical protein